MSNPTPPTPPNPDDASATDEAQVDDVEAREAVAPAASEAVAPEGAAPAEPEAVATEVPAPAAHEAAAPEAVAPEAVAPEAPVPAEPTEIYAPADAQPTEVYAPADAQPTQAYPPADGQPTEVYPPAYGQPANDPSAYGQAAYGQPAYGAPVVGAPAVSAADRPRTMGWISLGLAIGGFALVAAAFIPLVWVSLILALVGGIVLLVALVLGIVTLASKKQGGKGLGIGAIALSVLGGMAWIGAITLAFVLIAVSVPSVSEPSPSASDSVEVDPEDEATEEPTGTYDEAAFLAQVRPEITAIMQEIEPSITEEMLGQFYSDEMLVATGKGVLVGGDAARDAFVTATVESSGGTFTEDQATRFFDALQNGAEQYLVE